MRKPHENAEVIFSGKPEEAKAAIILLHGRGATAESILSLKEEIKSDHFFYAAPQANGGAWYPYSFLAPERQNEPWLSSALELTDKVVKDLTDKGFAESKIILSGFSQGACLALEYSAKSGRKLGGVFGFSGGLIGEDLDVNKYDTNLEGVHIFLGCSDIDFHIPVERVNETAELFRELGADVIKRIYPGMGHTINQDELNYFNDFLNQI